VILSTSVGKRLDYVDYVVQIDRFSEMIVEAGRAKPVCIGGQTLPISAGFTV
jgi:hypothetical protein